MSDVIEEMQVAPPLPAAVVLPSYSSYVMASYAIAAMIIGFLLIRTFSRAKRALRSYEMLKASKEKTS